MFGIAVGVAALTVAAVALAATGKLTPKGCIQDNDQVAAGCTGSFDGLFQPRGAVVSPDGKSMYVASSGDDAVVQFKRNTTNGALTPKACVDDNDSGPDDCATSSDGLNGAREVAISPDGSSVYVAAQDDDAIAHFQRDGTGALTFVDCVDDNDSPQGEDTCATSTDGLFAAQDVAVSPDGASVYATSGADDAVVTFSRDPDTGSLTPQGCIDDDASGPDTCADSTPGLDAAISVDVAPDGASVYVTGRMDDAIVRFERDIVTGGLTPKGCIEDNDTGTSGCAKSTDGLDGAKAMAISADGTSLYAGGELDDAVVRFDRDPATGRLAARGCIDDNDAPQGPDDCAKSTDGLDGIQSLVASEDGVSLYTAGNSNDAVVRFSRDPASGRITPRGCIDDPQTGFDTCLDGTAAGLGDASGTALSPDGSSLYVTATADSAVVRFKRDVGP